LYKKHKLDNPNPPPENTVIENTQIEQIVYFNHELTCLLKYTLNTVYNWSSLINESLIGPYENSANIIFVKPWYNDRIQSLPG